MSIGIYVKTKQNNLTNLILHLHVYSHQLNWNACIQKVIFIWRRIIDNTIDADIIYILTKLNKQMYWIHRKWQDTVNPKMKYIQTCSKILMKNSTVILSIFTEYKNPFLFPIFSTPKIKPNKWSLHCKTKIWPHIYLHISETMQIWQLTHHTPWKS